MCEINRSAVRRLALDIAARDRPACDFRRVGESFIDRIETAVRLAVKREVAQHPSKGRTLK